MTTDTNGASAPHVAGRNSHSSVMRGVVRIDAVSEVLLAAFCFALAVTGAESGTWHPSTWLSAPILAGIGIVLLLVGAVLWWMSSRLTRPLLTALSLANAVTGVVMLAWVSVDESNGVGVRALITVAAMMLVTLALQQWSGRKSCSQPAD